MTSLFAFFRRSPRVLVLRDDDAFWAHCDRTQRIRHTPRGPESDAEERLDLRAAQALKALLDADVGPEDGADPAHRQNWDWHDDRRRHVAVLRRAFRPALVPRLQALLVGELADFEVILSIHDDWASPPWGHLQLGAGQVAVPRHVAQAFALAAG